MYVIACTYKHKRISLSSLNKNGYRKGCYEARRNPILDNLDNCKYRQLLSLIQFIEDIFSERHRGYCR
jgi:hypothetical protein